MAQRANNLANLKISSRVRALRYAHSHSRTSHFANYISHQEKNYNQMERQRAVRRSVAKNKKRQFRVRVVFVPLFFCLGIGLAIYQFQITRRISKQEDIIHAIGEGLKSTLVSSTHHYDSRLPRKPLKRVTKPTDKVLVVYSGPTSLLNLTTINDSTVESVEDRKTELYRRNFEHFLKYGVQCKTQDTVLVVTDSVEKQYRSQIDEIDRLCQTFGHFVRLAIRNNTCLDLETVRLVMHDGKSIGVDVDSYDYFVYANCGTTGPSRKWADLPWTDAFIEKLNDKVKMSGLSLNCDGPIHIQSMVFALDKISLSIIRNSNAIFDCTKALIPDLGVGTLNKYIIDRYERGMSSEIMRNGYAISPIINPIVFTETNKSVCETYGDTYTDQWMTKKMKDDFGRILDLKDTIFFKTSRLISSDTAEEIKFNLTHSFSW